MTPGLGIARRMHYTTLGIEINHYRVGDGSAGCSDFVSTLCQLGSDSFLNAIVHRKTSQSSERFLADGIRLERILTVFCAEAWRRDCVLRHHAKFNMVENAIESRLILQIAARYADGNDTFAVFKDYCRRERDARAFAGLDTVRMAWCGVKAPESVAVCHSQLATDRVRSVAAGRRCQRQKSALRCGGTWPSPGAPRRGTSG